MGDLSTIPIGGGEAKAITTGRVSDSQPAVSPDCKWIAFVSDRDGSENLRMPKIDGSEPKQLSKGEQGDLQSPSWTPDGE